MKVKGLALMKSKPSSSTETTVIEYVSIKQCAFLCGTLKAGIALVGWQVFPLQLEDLTPLKYQNRLPVTLNDVAGIHRETFTVRLEHGPLFLRGTFSANESQQASNGHPADTYLATPGFVKGLAFINGFNLGWYWPLKGPQQHLYIPGPLMKVGDNELVLLEMEAAPIEPHGELVDVPDFTSFRPLTETKRTTHALPK